MGVKRKIRNILINLVINKPAFKLSESNYYLYILYLSRVLSVFRITSRIKAKEIYPFENLDFPIYKIIQENKIFLIQSKYRISRFLLGSVRASERQWERYNFDTVLMGEIPDLLIDVGANIGEFSYAAYSRKIKRVLAIEPDFIARKCLESNLSATGTEIIPFALGNQIGETYFYLNTATADSSLEPDENGSIKVKVQMETLDSLETKLNLKGKIALKMDAEGFEVEVLNGGENLLKSVFWIAIDGGPERSGKPTFESVVKLLKGMGFSILNVDQFGIVSARR
jgi:hypothetical protein